MSWEGVCGDWAGCMIDLRQVDVAEAGKTGTATIQPWIMLDQRPPSYRIHRLQMEFMVLEVADLGKCYGS